MYNKTHINTTEIDNKNPSGLYIVATPIGNMGDISNRAIDTLKNVDFIICENPNHSRKLMSKLGIKKKLVALHDYNEEKIIRNYIEIIRTKPVAEAATPEYEFNNEMTTGISAPPIGMVNVIPINAEMAMIA